MTFQSSDDLITTGTRNTFEQSDASQDHAGGAITALHSTLPDERFLDRMEYRVRGEPFNSDDAPPGHCRNGSHARLEAAPVDDHGTGATGSLSAAVFRAGEVELVSDHIQQAALWIR